MKKMYSRNKLFFGTTVLFNVCFFIGSTIKIIELYFKEDDNGKTKGDAETEEGKTCDKKCIILDYADQIENIVTGLGN